MSPWLRRALAVLAGVLWAFSFPNPNVAGLAWIAPGLLLYAARGANRFALGYLTGLTHYLILLSWLLEIPVRFYPILGWIALAAYLAVYPALWAWLCGRIVVPGSSTWFARLGQSLLCATIWVALEMIVSRLFSGFPWNLLGASQQKLVPLIQIASVTGVYGLSFVMVWFSISLLHVANALVSRPGSRHVWVGELALPMVAVAMLYAFGLHKISSAPKPERVLRIALIQPSIPQTMIWNSADAGARFVQLLRLSTDALTNKPNVMIWPEAAVPAPVREDAGIEHAITSLARTNNCWMIIGSDDFEMQPRETNYFNSSFLVSPRGELSATYRKRRLVIFGEYVPLVKWLPFIKYLTPISGGFAAGEKPVTFDFDDRGLRTSVLICFEDTFAHYAREHATADVDFLVNITNDGWFGESAEQWQHAMNSAFRAVENGLPLVRCSNNGISCWIDATGVMRDVGFDNPRDVYRAGVKVIELPINPAARRSSTFYNRYGDWFGWACVIVALVPIGMTVKSRISARRRE